MSNQQPMKIMPQTTPLATVQGGNAYLTSEWWKFINQIANNSVGAPGSISDEYLEIFLLNEIDGNS